MFFQESTMSSGVLCTNMTITLQWFNQVSFSKCLRTILCIYKLVVTCDAAAAKGEQRNCSELL